ncbi:MAG TPA: hypothetical protein VIT23_07245 [Terrimicrobiaceae bacterium]
MPARETPVVEQESANPNQKMVNDFFKWKEKAFTRYVRAFALFDDKFLDADALGKLNDSLRATGTDFRKDHEKFAERVAGLETALRNAAKDPKETEFKSENNSEFNDVQIEQVQLQNRLTSIRMAVAQAEGPTPPSEEKPTAPSQNADSTITKYTLIAAGVGIVPIPGLDIIGIAGVQGKMLHELYVIYYPDDPEGGFSKKFTQNLLTVVVSSFGAQYLFLGAFGSALKFFPIIGSLPGGGAVSLIGATSTFVVGHLVKEQLEKGLSASAIEDTLKTVAREKIDLIKKQAPKGVRA